MLQAFLSGHGGWTAAQGYVQVPKGCKVHFYTNFAKNLITGMEYMILEGTYTEIDRTIDEYHQCPNMKLSSQDKSWTDKSSAKLKARKDIDWALVTAPAGKSVTLNDVFEYYKQKNQVAEFHWLACQTLGLQQVGGWKFGLNAGDFAHDASKPAQYRITQKKADGGTIFQWTD